jgi:uncharacterized protein (TIGR02145 family)
LSSEHLLNPTISIDTLSFGNEGKNIWKISNLPNANLSISIVDADIPTSNKNIVSELLFNGMNNQPLNNIGHYFTNNKLTNELAIDSIIKFNQIVPLTISTTKNINEEKYLTLRGKIIKISKKDVPLPKQLNVILGSPNKKSSIIQAQINLDSSFISLVPPPPFDTTWSNYSSGAYSNNTDVNGNVIGIFYNYYAITDSRRIAPAGWHIPSDEEWKQLERYLGMASNIANNSGWRGDHQGEKLKVVNGTLFGWADYGTVWPTNESGFSALAMGCRMFDGSWGTPGQYSTSFWWTSSIVDSNNAWYRHLDYKNANVFRYYGPKNYGFSVRCVKD